MSNKILQVLICHLYFDHSYEIADISKVTGLANNVILEFIDQAKDSYEQRFA